MVKLFRPRPGRCCVKGTGRPRDRSPAAPTPAMRGATTTSSAAATERSNTRLATSLHPAWRIRDDTFARWALESRVRFPVLQFAPCLPLPPRGAVPESAQATQILDCSGNERVYEVAVDLARAHDRSRGLAPAPSSAGHAAAARATRLFWFRRPS